MGEGLLSFGVDCDISTERQKALMSHRNAPLTETGRLRLARCVVDDGWPRPLRRHSGAPSAEEGSAFNGGRFNGAGSFGRPS